MTLFINEPSRVNYPQQKHCGRNSKCKCDCHVCVGVGGWGNSNLTGINFRKILMYSYLAEKVFKKLKIEIKNDCKLPKF